MSKFKQILKALAGTALNVPDGELTALFEKAEDDIDVTEVADKLKAKYRDNLNVFGKLQKDEGFKASERATSKKFEGLLKTKFNITSDKEGDELIDEVLAATKKDPSEKGKGSMSEDDIKKSDVFIKMENLYKKQVADANEETTKKITEIEQGYKKKENLALFNSWADKKLDELGYHFDDDPVRAKNKREDFLNKFSDLEIEFNEGQPILSKEGKLLENEFKHKVDPANYLDAIAEKYYAKKVAQKRDMPGDQQKRDGQGDDNANKYSGPKPTNLRELDVLQSDPSIPNAHKLQILNDWDKANAGK